MGTSLLSPSRRAAWRVVAVAALSACVDGTTGPGDRFGNLRVHPVLEEGGRPAELGLDRIHIVVRRANGRAEVDTTLSYDVGSDRTYDWLIRLENEADDLDVSAHVLAGADSMYAGARDVVLQETFASEGPVQDVALDYVGRGAEAVSIAISPPDSVLTFGDSVQYHASGTDGQGRPVTDLIVFWETSDATRAPIRSDGWLLAPKSRAEVHVVASTPGSLVDSTTVTFIPVPTRVVPIAGDADTARVAEQVPLAVQVLADDGLGVRGIAVRFSGPAGASVRDTVVVSDAEGMARTTGTLGTTPGEYAFSAVAERLPGTPLRAVALAGPAAKLRFAVQPVFGIVNVALSPAVEVALTDAYGNAATETGVVVTLHVDANPGGGQLGGTSAVNAVSGVAAFHDVRIDARGNGYTLRAEAEGLAAAVTEPFDVTPRIAAISVTPGSATLQALAATHRLTATALDENGAPIPDVRFGWSTSSESVAAVDADGLVTAASNGGTVITATAAGVTGRSDITVAQRAVIVSVTPSTVRFTALGQTVPLAATAHDANGFVVAGALVVWTSSDQAIATVDNSGRVAAVTNGATEVTGTVDGASGAASVMVVQEAAEVVVTPGTVTLTALGATVQLSAEARDANGHRVADAHFTWTSSDAVIATVSELGLVTAVGNGGVTVHASAGAATGPAAVKVEQQVAQVDVAPGTVTLAALGETRRLEATARDAGGSPISGTTFTWRSSDPTKVSVDADGLVTAVANGNGEIFATSGGVSGGVAVTVSQVATSVFVAPGTASLEALEATERLTAGASDANGHLVPDVQFTWTSSNESVVTVDATGLVTAVANGEATITAAVGAVSGDAAVTVSQRVSQVAVTPDVTTLAALEQTVQLQAVGRDANGHIVPAAEFVWTTSNGEVAAVDASGLVTAVFNGATTITATAGGVAGSAGLTVRQVATAVAVTPEAVRFAALDTRRQLAVEAHDANGHEIAQPLAVWTSANGSVATVAAGLVTAVGNGATEVSATVDGATGVAVVEVSQVVAAVLVTPGEGTLTALEATLRLAADARDSNGHPVAGATFTWHSSNDAVVLVDATGLVTAVANGDAIVTATADGVSNQASVVVSQAVAGVTVSPDAPTLAALEAPVQLEATARDANGHPVAGAGFVWTSSAPAVVTVDGTGLARAVANGVATVTAQSGGTSGAATVTVAQRAAHVTVSPETATLPALEQTVQLAAAARDANGHLVEGSAFTWASSDPGVALVSPDGLVTATGNGAATISATLDGVTDDAAVTVSQVVTAVAVTPQAATLEALEGNVQLAAEARDANGHLVPRATFVWASSDAGVATVNQSGLVTAVHNGDAVVTATAGGVSARATISISQVVTAVRVTPSEVRLFGLGATAQLTAEARDGNGHLVDGQVFQWTSSNPGAATVDQTGLVAALDDGEASVSATASGVTGTARVIVQTAIEILIDVKPGSDENRINIHSRGVTPVAILTTSTFDARNVDPATVRFAGAAPVRGNRDGDEREHDDGDRDTKLEDVDGDGDKDMVLHFRTRELNLKPGDVLAELTGRTVTGKPFVGRDRVLVVDRDDDDGDDHDRHDGDRNGDERRRRDSQHEREGERGGEPGIMQRTRVPDTSPNPLW
jgi:uncharacterized protein YjdB